MSDQLISREALKKALKSNCDLCLDKNTNWCEHCCPLNDFEDLIDNAPTVSDRSVEIAKKSIELGRRVGRAEAKLYREETCKSKDSCDDYKYWHCKGCNGCKKGGAE